MKIWKPNIKHVYFLNILNDKLELEYSARQKIYILVLLFFLVQNQREIIQDLMWNFWKHEKQTFNTYDLWKIWMIQARHGRLVVTS